MFERLEDLSRHYEEVVKSLSEPDIMNDPEKYRKRMKEQADLEPIHTTYQKYLRAQQDEQDALAMLASESDRGLTEMAKEELQNAKKQQKDLAQELKLLLIPKDENDEGNIIMEIRGGAGGEEAALFAGTLYRMYMAYAEKRGWRTELLSFNESELGGYKEIVFIVNGNGAYARLKYEAGVHRVQRVPETESSGRIHTSTATVAVMPEVKDVSVEIDPADIRMEVYRSSGAGGQHINKTSSAVRLIHIPTGLVAACQEERSQLQNREKAMRLLRARLYEIEYNEQHQKMADEKRSQLGSGDRSEKIRTYNFPQGRVTDHRIKLTLYSIDKILNGDLDEVIEPLITASQAQKLAEMGEII